MPRSKISALVRLRRKSIELHAQNGLLIKRTETLLGTMQEIPVDDKADPWNQGGPATQGLDALRLHDDAIVSGVVAVSFHVADAVEQAHADHPRQARAARAALAKTTVAKVIAALQQLRLTPYQRGASKRIEGHTGLPLRTIQRALREIKLKA